MNEDEPIGGNSKLLSAYDNQAKAKAFNPKGAAAPEIIPESD
jgi:hypothetical protein